MTVTAQTKPNANQTATAAPPDLVDKILSETTQLVGSVEFLAERISVALDDEITSDLKRAIFEGMAVAELKKAISKPLIEFAREHLLNSELGFETDKPDNKNHYNDDVLKTCMIQAVLNGLSWRNREWMILHGKFLICKNGWWKKLHRIKGIGNISDTASPPHTDPRVKWPCVRVLLSWQLGGTVYKLMDPQGQDGVLYAITEQKSSTPQQLQGKALAQAYKMAYRQILGRGVGVDPEVAEAVPVAAVEKIAEAAQEAEAPPAVPMTEGERFENDQIAYEVEHPGWINFLHQQGRSRKQPLPNDLQQWPPGDNGQRDAFVARLKKTFAEQEAKQTAPPSPYESDDAPPVQALSREAVDNLIYRVNKLGLKPADVAAGIGANVMTLDMMTVEQGDAADKWLYTREKAASRK